VPTARGIGTRKYQGHRPERGGVKSTSRSRLRFYCRTGTRTFCESQRDYDRLPTSGCAGAENYGCGVSSEARRHGVARLGPATAPCPREKVLSIVDRFATCIRLTAAQYTLSGRGWRGFLPPYALLDRGQQSVSMKPLPQPGGGSLATTNRTTTKVTVKGIS